MPHTAHPVALVTGANSGIGRVSATELARRGFEVILAGRSANRTRDAVAAIRDETGNPRVEMLVLDLASLASVRRAAAAFLASGRPLHVLLNNAGVVGARGVTEDGFELAFGVNHLGHFLLTDLLLERLREVEGARVITVSSIAHTQIDTIDFDAVTRPTRTLTGLREYRASKLANVVFTIELARRLEGSGVSAFALDPGLAATAIWRRVPWPIRPLLTRSMQSSEEGARTSVHLATRDGGAEESGCYYVDLERREPNPAALDARLGEELWRRSREWTER